jgi:hypothetical protein
MYSCMLCGVKFYDWGDCFEVKEILIFYLKRSKFYRKKILKVINSFPIKNSSKNDSRQEKNLNKYLLKYFHDFHLRACGIWIESLSFILSFSFFSLHCWNTLNWFYDYYRCKLLKAPQQSLKLALFCLYFYMEA